MCSFFVTNKIILDLDRFVVQEFLNLTAELKNLNYKSVLDEYLLANDYPFQKEVKLGF